MATKQPADDPTQPGAIEHVSSAGTRLSHIPELLEIILLNVSCLDLLRFQLVDRFWASMVLRTKSLQPILFKVVVSNDANNADALFRNPKYFKATGTLLQSTSPAAFIAVYMEKAKFDLRRCFAQSYIAYEIEINRMRNAYKATSGWIYYDEWPIDLEYLKCTHCDRAHELLKEGVLHPVMQRFKESTQEMGICFKGHGTGMIIHIDLGFYCGYGPFNAYEGAPFQCKRLGEVRAVLSRTIHKVKQYGLQNDQMTAPATTHLIVAAERTSEHVRGRGVTLEQALDALVLLGLEKVRDIKDDMQNELCGTTPRDEYKKAVYKVREAETLFKDMIYE
ncbi:hypothetical protein P280DRAFT_464758 [Massarina eburnea CBS 473.64]|uniref:F-box domain-containing protein n=1 Tax=Massarina eburnea CBS 473.64 TaxID=1395130 RepID=A0A6A6SJJ0_9PLEO|nr:hypothetical protein P280DRAFT_464758 [Massarina eburnea CBS 473.64]